MQDLRTIKKPSVALIKLVEATGVLLGIPKNGSKEKSKYKAPSPTNYDNTVEYLDSNFSEAMDFLMKKGTADISNEDSFDLYTKVLEPGFDYEAAVNGGGLVARELFNLVHFVLLKLQANIHRLPVKQTNVFIVVDGTKSSYASMDIGLHIFSHGLCTIGTLVIQDAANMLTVMHEHLSGDLLRRCQLHYQIPAHCFRVETLIANSAADITATVQAGVTNSSSQILVVGMNDFNVGLDSNADFLLWACWDAECMVLFAKARSRFRPFSAVAASRVMQLCVKGIDDLKDVLLKSLSLFKPGDYLVIASVVDSRDAIGDNRESRFDFGSRCGWVEPPDVIPQEFPEGWNDKELENFQAEAEELMSKVQLEGKVCVRVKSPVRSTSQQLCDIAFEESVDVLMLKNNVHKDVIVETIRESHCSVAIIK